MWVIQLIYKIQQYILEKKRYGQQKQYALQARLQNQQDHTAHSEKLSMGA